MGRTWPTSARNQALTAENDKLRLTNADLVGANTDFSKRLEEAERERRFLNEQLAQARADLTKATNVLRENAGLWISRVARWRCPISRAYIQEVKTDQGRTFATVSLGSKEKVEKGMEFSVVDQTDMTFLGKFIVDSVDPDTLVRPAGRPAGAECAAGESGAFKAVGPAVPDISGCATTENTNESSSDWRLRAKKPEASPSGSSCSCSAPPASARRRRPSSSPIPTSSTASAARRTTTSSFPPAARSFSRPPTCRM
jgi:hypothetical protein